MAGMELPVEAQLRWILRRTATLLHYGAEPVSGLVQPTADFFPDRFDGSPPTLIALLRRVLLHAGLADTKVELAVVTPEGPVASAGCSSGACGGGAARFEARDGRVGLREDGSYVLAVGAGEVQSPLVLTTALVRGVSEIFLHESGATETVPAAERDPSTDLAGVLLGFGVLLANGSHIYAKGCSGVQVHSATKMPVDELTTALAVFCRLHEIPERAAARHLELTPREHFEEGYAWAASNSAAVRLLRQAPETIAADGYALQPARSWLARVLGVGKSKKASSPEEELLLLEQAAGQAGRGALGASKALAPRPVDPEKQRRLAELRALVDESLEG